MIESFRQLLRPAPTSATDSFKWSDKRPIRKQVAGGICKAGGLIAGFIVIIVAIGGLARLFDGQGQRRDGDMVLSGAALCVAVVVMVWTAHRWAPFVTAFFFGPAVLKIVGALFLFPDSYYTAHSISRTDAAELSLYAVAVVLLTSRFVGDHPAPTTLFDRLALTFFAFASFTQLVIPYRFPPWPLLLGGVALLAAWCPHRLSKGRHRPRHRRAVPGTPAKST
jgi:hypothetical protein